MEETIKIATLFIKEVGFPVFVGVYVLMRMEPTLVKLTEAINGLKTMMLDVCHPDRKEK